MSAAVQSLQLPGLDPGRIALIHDWLITDRGGERVLESLCRFFPEASIFTLFRVPGTQASAIERMRTRSSFIERLPAVRQLYRYYLPLFPKAIESFQLSEFDLVISSSHCAAKGVRVRPGARHLCYCHTPMRYAYDLFDDYFPRSQPVKRAVVGLLMRRVRAWDIASASRVGLFVANSTNTASRIRRYYGRESTVLHPPVDTAFFTPGGDDRTGSASYVLTVSALVPYKRIDRAVAAAAQAGIEYIVVGDGPERRRLEAIRPTTARFLGAVGREQLRELYRGCLAFVLPGEEDFGIAAVEAQACGRPVVALARGGALETVVEGETGSFFHTDSPGELAETIDKMRRFRFNSQAIRDRSLRFSRDDFETGLRNVIADYWRQSTC